MVSIDNILIVDLYKAIDKNDRTIISPDLTEDQFREIVFDYTELLKGDHTINEIKIEKLRAKVAIISTSLTYLNSFPMDEEIMDVLRSNGIVITKDNYPFDIIEIVKKLESLVNKLELLEKSDPKNKVKKEKKYKTESFTIYDMLASLSASLDGMYLDPRKVVVSEFIAYRKVLDQKRDNYEKIKSKSLGHGKNKR